METLGAEQVPHRSETMPEPRMLLFGQAKNTAIWMETPGPEQALHLSEMMPELHMLPFP